MSVNRKLKLASCCTKTTGEVLRCSLTHTSSVLCVASPVTEVDLYSPSNDQLQLPCIKYRHQPGVHHLCGRHWVILIWWLSNHSKPCKNWQIYLIETSDQRLSLLHHPSLHPPFGHSLDVILLVLLSHLQVGAARLQLPLCHLATQFKRVGQ